MKVLFIVNNYQLGVKVKTTPQHRIISQQRIDNSHTEIIYDLASEREKEFCEKVLARKCKVIAE